MPLGNFVITVEHLHLLINNVSKDKHLLTKNDLLSKDKMNFNSVEKITNLKVISNLLEYFPESKGTATFLSMCSFILDSFLAKNLTPNDRILKI